VSRQDHIREFAAAALKEGRVDYFIGWKEGYNSSEAIPAFVKNPDEVDQLIWNPLCANNLVTFIKRNMPDPAGAKIGLCVKGCDSRTLVALLQEELVDKNNLYVVGVPCDGIVDRRKLEKMFASEMVAIEFPERGKVKVTTGTGDRSDFDQKDVLLDVCSRCRYPNPVYSDDTAGPLEQEPDREHTEPDWSDIADYENLSDDDKQALLAKVYDTCIRCFACINACPVCYCWDRCVNRSRQPELVSQKVETKENLLFQMIHMMHVAGRCTSCGACDRACPVEIPLYLLHRKMNKEIYDMFGFEPGTSLDEKPVFQTFKIEDEFGE
jgi:formate dehydrogenase (coenzyme F420) beta subunit